MSQKCSLKVRANRIRIRKVFDDTLASLKCLDSTLYHYASERDSMRLAGTDLLRRFESLNSRLNAKLEKGDEYLD